MVAINFQNQFADLVESGRKTQTIRKANRFKAGDNVTLYTGQRTKKIRKLGEGAVVEVIPIHIKTDARYRRRNVAVYFQNGYRPKTCFTNVRSSYDLARQIAYADGFLSEIEMADWLNEIYGLPFDGWLIKWKLLL